MGRDYTPLQNADAFGFFDPIVKTGAASYESAGTLKNGERVWVMARLKRDLEITQGDKIARFLLLSNTHDGTGSVQVKFTPVRVVCKNTLNEALNRGPAIRVAHTPNMPVRLEDAAGVVLAAIEHHFDELGNRFRAMLKVQMLKPRLQEYLKAVFPDPSPGPDERRYKRAVLQAERDRADSERLFSQGMGNDLAGVKDTLWATYNGVTEYVDFHRGKFGDSKWLGEIWFGAPSVIKARALDEAISLARVN